MPLLFFHLRTDRGLEIDETGTPFDDVDSAYLDVCRAIPEMVDGLLRDGRDPLRCVFEIADEGGRPVMEVPFAERLSRYAAPQPAARRRHSCDDPMPGALADLASAIAQSRKVREQVQQTYGDVARLVSIVSEAGPVAMVHRRFAEEQQRSDSSGDVV